MLSFQFCSFLFVSVTIASKLPHEAHLLVKTSSGELHGNTDETLLNRRIFYSFRGIPYAKPPVGELRFRVSVQKTFGLFVCDFEAKSVCFFMRGATTNWSMAWHSQCNWIRSEMSANHIQFDKILGRRKLFIFKCVHTKYVDRLSELFVLFHSQQIRTNHVWLVIICLPILTVLFIAKTQSQLKSYLFCCSYTVVAICLEVVAGTVQKYFSTKILFWWR